MTYEVLVYGNGSNQLPTQRRPYATYKQALRYANSQITKGIVAIIERVK